MIDKLLENKLKSGARHFVDMPEVVFFDEVADHVEELEGAEITEFIADGTVEMWLEFEFDGYEFFVNNRLGDYRFYVQDTSCADEILLEIIDHFRRLVER